MSTEQIVVGLFFAGVTFILKMIFSRIDKNEKDLDLFKKNIDDKICAGYDTIRGEYKALTRVMEKNKQEIIALVSSEANRTVSINHCDAKQDLWGERFNNMMDKLDTYIRQDTKEHGQIIDTMTNNASARTQQMVDISERLSELSDCVKQLQNNKEC